MQGALLRLSIRLSPTRLVSGLKSRRKRCAIHLLLHQPMLYRRVRQHASPQNASLVGALPSELAAIADAEREAYASARNEVYIGCHELGSTSAVAPVSLSVSVRAPPQLPGWVSEEPEERGQLKMSC